MKFDVVMNTSPEDWQKMDAEEKAVSALAPFYSLAVILDGGNSMFDIPNTDTSRVLKALVDRAEAIFGISGLACVGSVEVHHG